MNLNYRIKELAEERFDGYDVSKFTYAIMFELIKTNYFYNYPNIVYKGYINESDIGSFENLSKKIESCSNISDLAKLTENEFYTLSAFIEYLDDSTESDLNSNKDLFNIRKSNYTFSFEHFKNTFLNAFKIKQNKVIENNIFDFIEDYNFLNFKHLIPILLNDQLNYTIQKTNFYKENISEINNLVSILKKEYPELNNVNNDIYNIEIEKDHKKIQTFESIFNNLYTSKIKNYIFSIDNYKNLLPFSRSFNMSNKIENISFQFYQFDKNIIFIDDLNSNEFYKKKLIPKFKEYFKDSIILTSSKELENNFGFKIINIKDNFNNFYLLNKKIGDTLSNSNINLFLEKFHNFEFDKYSNETFEKEFKNSIKKKNKLKM